MFFADLFIELLWRLRLEAVSQYASSEKGIKMSSVVSWAGRAGLVLALAAEYGHRTLVLGAWGCGVFRNSPADVAKVFAEWLKSPAFAGAFDLVVFGIYERDETRPILETFKRELAEIAG